MKPQSWIIGIVATLAATAIGGMVVLYGDYRVMRSEVDNILFDETTDEGQDRKITKQWARQSWMLSRINELRIKNDMPLAEWPE